MVRSLRLVQSDEFAVILLERIYAGISGFETAKLIRGELRSRHTQSFFLPPRH